MSRNRSVALALALAPALVPDTPNQMSRNRAVALALDLALPYGIVPK